MEFGFYCFFNIGVRLTLHVVIVQCISMQINLVCGSWCLLFTVNCGLLTRLRRVLGYYSSTEIASSLTFFCRFIMLIDGRVACGAVAQ